MKSQDLKQETKKPGISALPLSNCLLIQAPDGRMKVVSLDQYDLDSEHQSMYLEAVEKYGANNVRLCRIRTVKIKYEAEIID